MIVLIDGVNIICNNFPSLLTNKNKTLVPFFLFAHFGSETKTVPLVEMGTFSFFLEAATTTTKIGFVYSRYSKKPKLTILEIVHICYLMIRSILIYDQ